MKNVPSASTGDSSNFIDVEIVSVDRQQTISFNHKWVQVKQPVGLQQSLPQQIQDEQITTGLATDPLLAMLCLVFAKNSELPSERSQLYKEGLEILLAKWDDKHQIERDGVYKRLSLQRKQDLLSQIALKTFAAGDYFFQQDVERYIADYIGNLPDAQTHPEILELDSAVVLQAIEAQHGLLVERVKGVYAFADSKFHQYFTARGIINSSNPQALEQSLSNLVNQITEPNWQEVFLFLVEMLPNADYLLSLIKQRTDALVAADAQLLFFLAWLNQKSQTEQAVCKPAAFRAFCLEFILGSESDSEENFAADLDFKLVPQLYQGELQNFALNPQQKYHLQQYYNANKLLLDCLNHACYISRTLRVELEGSLLVPAVSSQTESAIV